MSKKPRTYSIFSHPWTSETMSQIQASGQPVEHRRALLRTLREIARLPEAQR